MKLPCPQVSIRYATRTQPQAQSITAELSKLFFARNLAGATRHTTRTALRCAWLSKSCTCSSRILNKSACRVWRVAQNFKIAFGQELDNRSNHSSCFVCRAAAAVYFYRKVLQHPEMASLVRSLNRLIPWGICFLDHGSLSQMGIGCSAGRQPRGRGLPVGMR